MKVLFIGGTGTISTSISGKLIEEGHELYLINRGSRNSMFSGKVNEIICDINDEETVSQKIKNLSFDAVADFIAYDQTHLERDYRLFKNKTRQFIYISTASAYHKPVPDPWITEGTSLANPFWEYSRKKMAGEDYLMKLYREERFPVTIIRPSHTYDERKIPLGLHGTGGSWQNLKRMIEGKPVIIHGDGTSLWTLTHSRDFAEAFTGLLGNPHAIGEAFHITSDESLTWNQIYETIAEILGVKLKAVHVSSEFLSQCGKKYDLQGSLLGDKANTVLFDNSKIKRTVPGFTAKISFSAGIAETIRHILAHPELQTGDPDFDVWCDRVIAALEKAKQEIKGTSKN